MWLSCSPRNGYFRGKNRLCAYISAIQSMYVAHALVSSNNGLELRWYMLRGLCSIPVELWVTKIRESYWIVRVQVWHYNQKSKHYLVDKILYFHLWSVTRWHAFDCTQKKVFMYVNFILIFTKILCHVKIRQLVFIYF